MYHALIYGYFQHGYEVWYAMQKNIADYSHSDLLLQKQAFASIRSSIRGFENFSGPTAISGIASMLGSERTYPRTLVLNSGNKFFYDKIINLSFKDLNKYLRKYYRITKGKMIKEPHSELISSLRTPEAVEYLIKKFRKEKPKLIRA